MKLRKLKKLLNNTDYIIQKRRIEDKRDLLHPIHPLICIGSSYVSDLIFYDIITEKLGHSTIFNHFDDDTELSYIWKRMKELHESGELNEIIFYNDEILDPIPVFSYRNGQIFETVTERDEFGYPFVDNEGWLMYENSSFHTRKECVNYAIQEGMSCLVLFFENAERKIDELHATFNYAMEHYTRLKKLVGEKLQSEERNEQAML